MIIGFVLGLVVGAGGMFVLCVRHLVKRQTLMTQDGVRLAVVDLRFGRRRIGWLDVDDGHIQGRET